MKRIINKKIYETEQSRHIGTLAPSGNTNDGYECGRKTKLMLTKRGDYFLATYSQWQGERDTIRIITKQFAYKLYCNECQFYKSDYFGAEVTENEDGTYTIGLKGDNDLKKETI